jgi:uncharacterized membrane protein (DUF485 family)
MLLNVGISLILIGVLVAIGYMAKGFFSESSIPLAFRVAVGLAAVGFVIALIAVVRDRLKAASKDDFKGVQR